MKTGTLYAGAFEQMETVVDWTTADCPKTQPPWNYQEKLEFSQNRNTWRARYLFSLHKAGNNSLKQSRCWNPFTRQSNATCLLLSLGPCMRSSEPSSMHMNKFCCCLEVKTFRNKFMTTSFWRRTLSAKKLTVCVLSFLVKPPFWTFIHFPSRAKRWK